MTPQEGAQRWLDHMAVAWASSLQHTMVLSFPPPIVEVAQWGVRADMLPLDPFTPSRFRKADVRFYARLDDGTEVTASWAAQ